MARQDARLAETRAFLDRLWRYEGVFDPDLQCTYADRARRRQPGDKTLGLSPHMDAGTVERWIDPGYQRVYEHVFAGDWRGYDRFDAAHRLRTHEIPSPAVCSMFRTFQGWSALTRQGPKDGTLRLIPLAEGIAYGLLRALQDDVDETDLCGAAPGRALGMSPEWHPDLMAALVSIPEVMPGTRCSGTRTFAMRWAMNTPAANTPASSTSDPRQTARKTARIFPSSGRHFCRGVRRLTLPRWTLKSISRGERRSTI